MMTHESSIGRVHLRVVPNNARPRTRAECIDTPRPCPWVSCRHNLFLDVDKQGVVHENFRGLTPDEVPPELSCSLDLAEEDGLTLDDIGELLGGISREAVRQIETKALQRVHNRVVLEEFAGERSDQRLRRSHAKPFVAGPIAQDDDEPVDDPEFAIARCSDMREEMDDAVCDTVWSMLEKRRRRRMLEASPVPNRALEESEEREP